MKRIEIVAALLLMVFCVPLHAADIVLDKDGSILVADDWAGAIYRISYKK